MLNFIFHTIQQFCSCFSRKSSFQWFSVIILGFLIRGDKLGITSVIRDFCLAPASYDCLIHFFHSSAWKISDIRKKWYQIVLSTGLIYRIDDRCILAGDGVKQAKEAYRMPGVKKLHQESEDSSKAEYIYGHLFGAVGVILGNHIRNCCIPLKINLQDGLASASKWKDSGISGSSHVIQMVENGYEVAKTFGKSIFVLDRYFLSVPALKRLKELNCDSGATNLLEIVTKAKMNCVAYEEPQTSAPKRTGRPRKKGNCVKLRDLFQEMSLFTTAYVTMYGKEHIRVEYLCKDLLWGQKHYQKLRFVLVLCDAGKSILVSTDLTLSPEKIIEIYAHRFKIESMFREMKQCIGAFSYHFWTSTLDRLNHYKKKEEQDNLSKVTEEKMQKHIYNKIKAIEGFVLFASIAFGLLQICSIRMTETEEIQKCRYLRTVSCIKVSEGTMMAYLRRSIFPFMLQHPEFGINDFIQKHQQKDSATNKEDIAA